MFEKNKDTVLTEYDHGKINKQNLNQNKQSVFLLFQILSKVFVIIRDFEYGHTEALCEINETMCFDCDSNKKIENDEQFTQIEKSSQQQIETASTQELTNYTFFFIKKK